MKIPSDDRIAHTVDRLRIMLLQHVMPDFRSGEFDMTTIEPSVAIVLTDSEGEGPTYKLTLSIAIATEDDQ